MESEIYRDWGCNVIGMTNMPEAKLAEKLRYVIQLLLWLLIMIVGIPLTIV